MHKHNWLCSDVPGVYTCTFNCGFGYWNPETKQIEEQ
jgi:hypothetical protein